MVHTGAKIQLGGLKDGLFIVEYQLLIAGIVKIAPAKPIAWQKTMLPKSRTILTRLLFFSSIIFFLYYTSFKSQATS